MTIIKIDNLIRFDFTAADLIEHENGRRYLAASPPHRLVIVVYPGIDGPIPDCLIGNFDCSLGEHSAHAPVGYTLPQFAGQPHSKITIRSRVDNQPHDMTWQDVLDGCPSKYKPENETDWRGIQHSTWTYPLVLPEHLKQPLIDYAARRAISIDVAIWKMIMGSDI